MFDILCKTLQSSQQVWCRYFLKISILRRNWGLKGDTLFIQRYIVNIGPVFWMQIYPYWKSKLLTFISTAFQPPKPPPASTAVKTHSLLISSNSLNVQSEQGNYRQSVLQPSWQCSKYCCRHTVPLELLGAVGWNLTSVATKCFLRVMGMSTQ